MKNILIMLANLVLLAVALTMGVFVFAAIAVLVLGAYLYIRLRYGAQLRQMQEVMQQAQREEQVHPYIGTQQVIDAEFVEVKEVREKGGE